MFDSFFLHAKFQVMKSFFLDIFNCFLHQRVQQKAFLYFQADLIVFQATGIKNFRNFDEDNFVYVVIIM